MYSFSFFFFAVIFSYIYHLFNSLDNQELIKECKRLKLPSLKTQPIEPPQYGKWPVVDETENISFRKKIVPFRKYSKYISNNLYIFNNHVIDCFVWLHEEFNTSIQHLRYFSESAFRTLTMPCDINDFYKCHVVQCENITKFLNSKWRNGFMELMLDRAVDAFQFFEQDEATYQKSKTCKLLKSLNLRMTNQLRYILDQSILDMMNYLKKFGFILNGNETCDTASTTCPLFLVKLVVPDGNHVVFSPSSEERKLIFIINLFCFLVYFIFFDLF